MIPGTEETQNITPETTQGSASEQPEQTAAATTATAEAPLDRKSFNQILQEELDKWDMNVGEDGEVTWTSNVATEEPTEDAAADTQAGATEPGGNVHDTVASLQEKLRQNESILQAIIQGAAQGKTIQEVLNLPAPAKPAAEQKIDVADYDTTTPEGQAQFLIDLVRSEIRAAQAPNEPLMQQMRQGQERSQAQAKYGEDFNRHLAAVEALRQRNPGMSYEAAYESLVDLGNIYRDQQRQQQQPAQAAATTPSKPSTPAPARTVSQEKTQQLAQKAANLKTESGVNGAALPEPKKKYRNVREAMKDVLSRGH
jgi:hypothetical protein